MKLHRMRNAAVYEAENPTNGDLAMIVMHRHGLDNWRVEVFINGGSLTVFTNYDRVLALNNAKVIVMSEFAHRNAEGAA